MECKNGLRYTGSTNYLGRGFDEHQFESKKTCFTLKCKP
ncbi:hypothetical protein [Maribacter aquimaris]